MLNTIFYTCNFCFCVPSDPFCVFSLIFYFFLITIIWWAILPNLDSFLISFRLHWCDQYFPSSGGMKDEFPFFGKLERQRQDENPIFRNSKRKQEKKRRCRNSRNTLLYLCFVVLLLLKLPLGTQRARCNNG